MTPTTTQELLQEIDMKRPALSTIPQHDYEQAGQSAVSWLGDRYLLAAPINRKPEEPSPFFVQPRQWHTAVIGSTPRVS
jgi:hypothetical protein